LFLALAATRSGWAVALVLLMMPLKQCLQGNSQIFLNSPTLTNYLVGAAIGISSVRAFFGSGDPLRGVTDGPMWLFVILLNIWAIVSLAWTPAYDQAMAFTQVGWQYAALFIVFSPFLISDAKALPSVWFATMVAGCVISILIITSNNFSFNMGRLSIKYTSDSYSNVLALGELGGLLIISSVIFRPAQQGRSYKLLRIVAFFVGATIAIYSGSRGQILFALAVVALVRPISQGKGLRNVIASMAFLAFTAASMGVLALLLLPEASMLDRWQPENLEGGVFVRFLNASDLVVAFLQTPYAWIIGLGFNAFAHVSAAVKEPYTHNVSLDVLCELGIPAFAVLCSIYLLVWKSATRLIQTTAADSEARRAVAVIIAIALYEFLLNHKQGFFWSTGPMFFAFLLINKLAAEQGGSLNAPSASERLVKVDSLDQ
jgi:hypothetical protein